MKEHTMASDQTNGNPNTLSSSSEGAALIHVDNKFENETRGNQFGSKGGGGGGPPQSFNPRQDVAPSRPVGYSLATRDQSPDDPRWKSRRCNASRAPIAPTNCFDIIISCGFGSKSYFLGPGFSDPQFRVRFATKVYCVLLVQLLIYILWMTLVLTSKTLLEIHKDGYGIAICSSLIYILIYVSLRFTTRGEDGLCFMSYLILFIFLSVCGALVSGWAAVAFPCGAFVTSAIWFTILILAVGNKCTTNFNIHSNLVYGLALFGAVLGSTMMAALYYHCGLIHGALSENLWTFILPLSVIPSLMSLMLVYEMKRLIGGRRTNLNDHEWIVAAIVL